MHEFTSLEEMLGDASGEQGAIKCLRAILWGTNDVNVRCPYCASIKVYHFSDNRKHKCANCRKQFSIKSGTIFEGSKVQLHKWLSTIWLITSQKKGITSTQLAKEIEVSQKTAWLMLHHLRYATETKSFKLSSQNKIDCAQEI